MTKLEKQLQEIFKEMKQVVKSDKGIVLESENSQKGKQKKRRESPLHLPLRKKQMFVKNQKKRLRKEKNNVKGNLPERKYGKPRHPYYSKRVGSHA